ncbi:MAG TPA: TetR/AcrR family transcriptional regulator [Vicinamibacterales bacterium]|jgi:AcrR family transcriptional regulator|nr:TetR/AcrR family transcriptional regulator [Vicinamibacterales bacterium]
MGITERRARQKTLLRQQILDAARDLLVREGYEKLSMRRVAARIDYSPTAIYLHFKDKQDLVSSLCDETFARLIRELETLPDEYPDPVARLRKGLERYIAFGLKHPEHYLPTFVLPLSDHADSTRKEEISSGSNGMRAFGFLRECIADGVKARKLRKVDPEIAARAAWAGIHGITSLLIVHDAFPWGDRQAVAAGVVDLLVEGLRRR